MGLGWPAFQTAMDGCEHVIRTVPDDHWDADSPCEGWTARDVAGHLIGGIVWGADLIGGGTAPPPSQPQRLRAHPVAAWESARSALESACTPGALERRVSWPFGEQTVDRGLGLFSLEVLVHSWDIASAAGLEVILDPKLVHEHLTRLQPVGHLLRGPGMYGAELPAPSDPTEQDRLLAFLGRRVS